MYLRSTALLLGAFVCLAASAWGRSFSTPSEPHARSSATAPAAAARAADPAETPASGAPIGILPVSLRSALRDGARLEGISGEVLDLALNAVECATRSGAMARPETLTLIDYSRPSVKPRLWVFDLGSGTVLFRELVAHGVNTGQNLATAFSNTPNSRQSSLGLFVTDTTYMGGNGYSLRLDGLEPGFNDRARERAIVMHGAWYVSDELAGRQGRIGRSWGCPALRAGVARTLIDRIRGGGAVFAYYPDQKWLSGSRFLQGRCDPSIRVAD